MNKIRILIIANLLSFSILFGQGIDSIQPPNSLPSTSSCGFTTIIDDFDDDNIKDIFMIWSSGDEYGCVYSPSKKTYLLVFKNSSFYTGSDYSSIKSKLSFANLDNDPGVEIIWDKYILKYQNEMSTDFHKPDFI